MIGWLYRRGGPQFLWQGGLWQLPVTQQKNCILITFDDGPSTNSLRCGEILARHGHRALFFLVAERARKSSDLVCELCAQGHQIGSHGLWHKRHAWLSQGAVRRSVNESQKILQELSGQQVKWFRPPYGSWFPWQNAIVADAGMRCMYWSLNPHDYANIDASVILKRVGTHSAPSAILLLHCTGQNEDNTRKFLGQALDSWQKKGVTLVDPAQLK